MFNYNQCPICKGESFKAFISCKDHTVSNETFDIVSCASCSFKFTNPIPAIKDLGNYYKSEEYISHSDTKKGLISKLYHWVRNYTIGKKIKLVSEYSSKGIILDYGCGTGAFLKVCLQNGWKAFGMEPDEGARKIAQEGGVKCFEGKGQLEDQIPDNGVKAITLWHVLEHVSDLEDTLNFFYRKLDPDGTLIVAVPNHRSYDAQNYGKFWAAYDVPRHLYHFERQTIKRLLEKHKFDLVETLPMKFDSFYVSMLSEKYQTGSMSYLKAFTKGLMSNIKANSSGEYSSLIYIFKKK